MLNILQSSQDIKGMQNIAPEKTISTEQGMGVRTTSKDFANLGDTLPIDEVNRFNYF
jgi:hypothetical protein